MKSVVRRSLAALVVAASAPGVFADQCTALAGQTQCFSFKYSNGGQNKYTVVFGTDGTLTLNGTSTGTYTCAGGQSLLEVDYLYNNVDQQQWYAVAGTGGSTVTGNAKSLTHGYMYKLSSKSGACGGEDVTPGHSTRQDE